MKYIHYFLKTQPKALIRFIPALFWFFNLFSYKIFILTVLLITYKKLILRVCRTLYVENKIIKYVHIQVFTDADLNDYWQLSKIKRHYYICFFAVKYSFFKNKLANLTIFNF